MLQRVHKVENEVRSDTPNVAGLPFFAKKKMMEQTLQAVEHDKTINRHETIYPYIEAYKAQGEDIVKWYDQHQERLKWIR